MHVCVFSCRSCASVVRLMGTAPAVKSACCVWGIFGRSAATAWVSAGTPFLLATYFKADRKLVRIVLGLENFTVSSGFCTLVGDICWAQHVRKTLVSAAMDVCTAALNLLWSFVYKDLFPTVTSDVTLKCKHKHAHIQHQVTSQVFLFCPSELYDSTWITSSLTLRSKKVTWKCCRPLLRQREMGWDIRPKVSCFPAFLLPFLKHSFYFVVVVFSLHIEKKPTNG